MPHKTGLTPEQSRITQTSLQTIARVIGPSIAPHSFILLTFAPADRAAPDGSRVNYVGNLDRAEAIAAMKEIIARWEGQALQGGRA